VPLAFAAGPDAELIRNALPDSVIGPLVVKTRARSTSTETRSSSGGEQVGVLYDPLGEKRFSAALLEAVFRHRHFKRSGGELGATNLHSRKLSPEFSPSLPAEPSFEPALLKGGYSNTLILFGERWLLKVYRRIEQGVNQELELLRFLAEKAAAHGTPALAGALEYRRSWGQPMTLAIVEKYVPNQANGWDQTCHALGLYFEQAMARQVPATELTLPGGPWLDLLDREVPALAQEMIGSHLGAMRLLGQQTAELHVALASTPEDPAFAPEPFTTFYQRSLYQSMRSQTRQTFAALRQRMGLLPEAIRDEVREALGREEGILRRAHVVLERKIAAARTRCHGDYHLGQVLFTGKEYVVLDWEGQANRPLSDRRRKRSPLRDVASMLTSFYYAVRSSLKGGSVRSQDIPVLEPWARYWSIWVSVAFLKSYLEVAGQDRFLPKSREELGALLEFFLLKRAVNEVHRELTYSPDRLSVALSGLLRLPESRSR
jgi:maltose alpha-D-glucosyltransferase/alpha-amylase